MISVEHPSDLVTHLGAVAVSEDAVLLDKALLEAFIAVSGDDQPIHRGPEAIAPGNLLLALTPRLLKSAVSVRFFETAMTVRIDRVAFRRPARVGDTLRLRATPHRVDRVKPLGGGRVAVTVACALVTTAEVATLRVTDLYAERSREP